MSRTSDARLVCPVPAASTSASGFCWACGESIPDLVPCGHCGAPFWLPNDGPSGVYIVQDRRSEMVKIGFSTSIPMRLGNFGSRVSHVRPLWGATVAVERWLHLTFSASRDPAGAHRLGLPAHTEWFWPTEALRRLAAGREFIRDGNLRGAGT